MFLSNYLPLKEGEIIDIKTGEVIGKHQGVFYYTIGQRKGFNVGGANGPYFLVGKDIHKNELYLCSCKDDYFLESDSCLIVDFNQQLDLDLHKLQCKAKFRYRQNDNDVYLEVIDKHTLKCYYPQKIKAVAIGQQAVFYLNDGTMIGGGTIDQTYINNQEVHEFIKNSLKRSLNE